MNHQPDIAKIVLYIKDSYEAKYKLLINIIHLNDPQTFIESSNNMDDIYKNIEEYHPNKKQKN